MIPYIDTIIKIALHLPKITLLWKKYKRYILIILPLLSITFNAILGIHYYQNLNSFAVNASTLKMMQAKLADFSYSCNAINNGQTEPICYISGFIVTPDKFDIITTMGFVSIEKPEFYKGEHIVDFTTITPPDNKSYELKYDGYAYLTQYNDNVVKYFSKADLSKLEDLKPILLGFTDPDIIGWWIIFEKANNGTLWGTAIARRNNLEDYCNIDCATDLQTKLTNIHNYIMVLKNKKTFII